MLFGSLFKTTEPPLEGIEKLFLFAVDQIEDQETAEMCFKNYKEALKKSGDERIFSIVKAYYACEAVSKDKFLLRHGIREKVGIKNLDIRIRLIFQPELEQALTIYETFSAPLVEFLINNLGIDKLYTVLHKQKVFPILYEMKIAHEGIDYTRINNIFLSNTDLKKKNIDDVFSFFYNILISEITTLFNSSTADNLLEKIFESIKSTYDFNIISTFLCVVPENTLENERLTFLSRDELELRVHERTFLLKKEKERVDQVVKEKTAALIDEQIKLRMIAENMNEGVFLLDGDMKPVYINSMGRKMLDLVFTDKIIPEFVMESFAKKFPSADIVTSFQKAENVNPFEIPEIDSDGKVYKITFSVMNDNSRKHFIVWMEDITERKVLERKKSEFISVVAHQLRTPLSGIKWSLHMLITGELGTITDEQRLFLDKAYDSNDRLIALINDMLSVDKIVSGRFQYFFVNIQLLDLVDTVIYESLASARKKNVSVSFKERPKNMPLVFADPEKLRAVMQNLLENAIKYTKENGTVLLHIEEKADYIHFEIEDNGIGIPPAEQGSIFSRFFRGSNAVRVQTDGSGLGLFIAKSIIEAHHGSIGFKSDLGKGTKFYFDIPKINK